MIVVLYLFCLHWKNVSCLLFLLQNARRLVRFLVVWMKTELNALWQTPVSIDIECLACVCLRSTQKLTHLNFKLVYFIIHPLHFTVVILSQTSHFCFNFVDFFVFSFLTFNKNYWMVEPFFHKVLVTIFTKNFYLTTKVVVRTFYKLKLAHFFMLLNVLSQCSLSALVFTLNDFEKASFIVSAYVFED